MTTQEGLKRITPLLVSHIDTVTQWYRLNTMLI
jgi:hypothetical protein